MTTSPHLTMNRFVTSRSPANLSFHRHHPPLQIQKLKRFFDLAASLKRLLAEIRIKVHAKINQLLLNDRQNIIAAVLGKILNRKTLLQNLSGNIADILPLIMILGKLNNLAFKLL